MSASVRRGHPLTAGQLEEHKRHLHFPAGYAPRSGKVTAVCHCGWSTTPRVSRDRARQALLDEHGFTGARESSPAECGICGLQNRWWEGCPWPWEVFQPLMEDGRPHLTSAAASQPQREVYVCRDADACHDRYQAAAAADQLRCGCSHTFVAAFGHYHDTAGTTPAAR